MPQRHLAIIDADRIHSYVFSPTKLKLIHGGSAIQARLNERQLLDLLANFGLGNVQNHQLLDEDLDAFPDHQWEAVCAGGGTVIVIFRSAEAAERYCRAAAELFYRHTSTATVSWAIAAHEGTFGAAMEQVMRVLELNKTGRGEHYFNGGSPYWKPCEGCGLHPACEPVREPGGAHRLYCRACTLRLKSGRSQYLEEFGRRFQLELEEASSFEDLAKRSRPENYLALVYLDVDRLGRYLHDECLDSPKAYRHASRKIREAVRDGIYEGCRALCPEVMPASLAPFLILLMGGDDGIVLLPAQHVFRFISRFTEHFERSKPGAGLSFSAGVVWAHHHFPIAQFLKHAEDRLNSAKRREGNQVDYAVITESLASGRQAKADESRTQKPYPAEVFAAFGEKLAGWKKARFPSSKAHELYQIAFEPIPQSILDYFFLLSRLDEGHRTLLQQEFRNASNGIWEGRPPTHTGAADLMELWDFVEAP